MAESRLADLTIDPSIESPAIWRVLADSPLAIYLAGPDGVLRHASRRAANLLGSTSESELLNAGANIFNWRTTAEDRAAFNAMLDAGPSARAQQAVYTTHDGEPLTVREVALRLPSGAITGAFWGAGGDGELSRLQERRFSDLYEHAAIGIYRSTEDGRPVFANPAFVRMMGYETEADWLAALTSIEREWYVKPTRRADFLELIAREGKVANFESEIYVHRTGEKIWISETARTVCDSSGATRFFEGTIENVTERKRMELALAAAKEAAEKRSFEDDDTGLANRRRLQLKIDEIEETREAGFVCALTVNRYAHIRTAIGPLGAAQMMHELARRLSERSGAAIVARIDAGTLGLVLETDAASEALGQARSLVAAGYEPVMVAGTSIDAMLCASLAKIGGPAAINPIDQAQIAIEQARAQSAVASVFNPRSYGDPARTLSLMSEMTAAMGCGDMSVAYQPKLDLRTGLVAGLEALVRWRHPLRGDISPDEFVTVAEETGHIRQLTDWLLDQVATECKELRQAGFVGRIAVNVSGQLFGDPRFAETVLSRIGDAGGDLCFEITETAVIQQPRRALHAINALRSAGVAISIDDYGTGLSSLSYLKQIPAHELKIDRAFIKDLNRSETDRLLVKSTVELAHSLGMTVVAEGVEDERTLASLRELGADRAQGYFIARPLPISKVIPRLEALRASGSKLKSEAA